MIQISLTDLVEIVSKAGTPKATKVRQIQTRPVYSPSIDFYRLLRNGMADVHKSGMEKSALKDLLAKVQDPKKLERYGRAIASYSQWWGNKNLEWFEPSRGKYNSSGIDVTINPELGLRIGGREHLVKLYFKETPLEKLRVDLVTVAMAATLTDDHDRGTIMSILDVNRAKLFTLSVPVQQTRQVIDAELAYVAALFCS